MVKYFTIIEFSLLGFPILAFLLFKNLKNSKNYHKSFLILLVFLSIYYVLKIFGFSIVGDMPDIIMLCLTYLAYTILVSFVLLVPMKIGKIIIFIIGLFPILIGYIFSTIGFFGLIMILAELETTNINNLTDNYEYREYGFGNATTSSGGTEYDFYKKYKLIPFEKKIASLKMDYRDYEFKNLNIEFNETVENYRIIIKSEETIQIDTLIKK